jgi:hypothetical protein
VTPLFNCVFYCFFGLSAPIIVRALAFGKRDSGTPSGFACRDQYTRACGLAMSVGAHTSKSDSSASDLGSTGFNFFAEAAWVLVTLTAFQVGPVLKPGEMSVQHYSMIPFPQACSTKSTSGSMQCTTTCANCTDEPSDCHLEKNLSLRYPLISSARKAKRF